MLLVSASTEQHVSAFPVEVTQSRSSQNAIHDAIVAKLSTLAVQMKTLANPVAAIIASSSRPTSTCEHYHPTIYSYCDTRGHTETDCYQQ
jgi:hypothetical protein